MYTPTDPVTGLPILNVPDVVDQIPLSKQVVPWDDLAATSRPPQGPAYPNDMLNTLSYVTGESVTSPGSMHAATMTDDRRLRVDTGSSGGGILGAAYGTSIQWEADDPGSFSDVFLLDLHDIAYIQGGSVVFGYSQQQPGTTSMVIKARTATNNNEVYLASAPIPDNGITGVPAYDTFTLAFTFWPLIDVAATWGSTVSLQLYMRTDGALNCFSTGTLFVIPA